MLEADGIDALLVDEHMVTNNPLISNAVGGIKVCVAQANLGTARQILEAKVAIEAEPCPNCGSSKVGRHQLGRRSAFLTILFLGIPIGRSRAQRRCEDCQHAWRE